MDNGSGTHSLQRHRTPEPVIVRGHFDLLHLRHKTKRTVSEEEDTGQKSKLV